jgi:hypothetical protein
VRQNRGQLVAAFLTLIQTWFLAGRPLFRDVALGSFEGWCGIVGGVVSHAGYPGFLCNLDDTVSRASSEETREWAEFFEAIYHWRGENLFLAKEVADLILKETQDSENPVAAALPSTLKYSSSNKPGNLGTALGTYFKKHAGRRFTVDGVQCFLDTPKAAGKGARVWVFQQETPSPSQDLNANPNPSPGQNPTRIGLYRM